VKTERQARTAAAKVAASEGVRMVVAFNPYCEYEDDSYTYCPEAAFHIFERNEVLLATIRPDGTVIEERKS